MRTIFLLSFVFLAISACMETKKERILPILGHYDIEYKTVNGKEVADTVYPKVPSFKFLNQDSVWVKKEDFKGKLLIVDFMFTHCPTICPTMTANMKKLTENTKDLESQIQFVSFSIDPKRDSPSRFREYIKTMGITAKNWSFLTGDEQETYGLAFDYFYVGVQRSDNPEEDFLHDDKFVLVDKEGYVRGFYEGTQPDKVQILENDIRKLLKHEYNYTSKN